MDSEEYTISKRKNNNPGHIIFSHESIVTLSRLTPLYLKLYFYKAKYSESNYMINL